MEVLLILAVIAAIVIAFFIGWKVAIHPDIVNNEQELQLKKILEIDIKTNQEKIKTLKTEQERLNQQYQVTQQYIEDAEKNADKIYKAKMEQLEEKYQQKIDILSKREKEVIAQYAAEQQREKQELESLKATKTAAIEAARKEKLIHQNQKDYCLWLPIEEQNDVSILRSVRNRISKPRAVSMVIWSAYYQPKAKKKFSELLGDNTVCGIYKITNQETGECYIGQAVDIRRRWLDHCKAGLGIDTPAGNKLYAAIQEYGLDQFSFELLEKCAADKLNEKERYFIGLYAADTTGYNGNKGNR